MKGRWLKLPVILATGFAELPPDIDPLQQITLAKPFLQYDLEQAVNAALEDPKKRRVVSWTLALLRGAGVRLQAKGWPIFA